MPRNRDRNKKHELDIYVILSEISDAFIVWKIKSGNAYTAYKDHARLKSLYTKDLFSKSIEQKKMPKMYLLETVVSSQREAMKHCIVWTKYFMEQGRTPLVGETMIEYTETLDEQSLAIYNEIKDQQMDKIINADTAIVENYQPRSWEKDKEKDADQQSRTRQIKLSMDQSDYSIIEENAKEAHMKVAAYCKAMSANGFIFRIDYAPYIEELMKIRRTIYDIESIIYYAGKYYPSDLENLQKCLDEVNQVQRQMMKHTTKKLSELKKRRKKLIQKVQEECK